MTASHDIVRVVRKIDIFNHIYPAAYYTRLMQIAPDYKDIGKRCLLYTSPSPRDS